MFLIIPDVSAIVWNNLITWSFLLPMASFMFLRGTTFTVDLSMEPSQSSCLPRAFMFISGVFLK